MSELEQAIAGIQERTSCNETFCLLGISDFGEVVTLCRRCIRNRILALITAREAAMAEALRQRKVTQESKSKERCITHECRKMLTDEVSFLVKIDALEVGK
jgi:hypothetical protein